MLLANKLLATVAFHFAYLPMPAGGMLTNLEFALDGTGVMTCDTYSPAKYDPAKDEWRHLLRANDSFPGEQTTGQAPGMGASICWSNSQVITIEGNNGIYTSVDGGETMVKRRDFTELLVDTAYKGWHRRIQNDPWNVDCHVICTMQADGFLVTLDGGASYARNQSIPTIMATDWSQMMGVAVDRSSAKLAGSNIASRWFVFVWNVGVFESTTGPAGQFTLIANSPKVLSRMSVGPSGVLFASDVSGPGIYRYVEGGAFVNVANTGYARGIAPHPTDATKVWAADDYGNLFFSSDTGQSFTKVNGFVRTAEKTPWAEWTNEGFLSANDLVFDLHNNRLAIPGGIGMWTYPNPSSAPVTPTYKFSSTGIYNMIGMGAHITFPVDGATEGDCAGACEDRPSWTWTPEEVRYPPNRHGPDTATAIQDSQMRDSAIDNPKFHATITAFEYNNCFIRTSPDRGLNWTGKIPMSALPYGSTGAVANGGMICVSNQNNWLVTLCFVEAIADRRPCFTQDGGATFALSDFGTYNSAVAANGGLIYNQKYLTRRPMLADKDHPGRFYVLVPHIGWFRSNDGGATFICVKPASQSGRVIGYWSEAGWSKIIKVPGKDGHFFYCNGNVNDGTPGDENSSTLYFTNDDGVNWRMVLGIGSVSAITAGPGLPGAAYPTIYMAEDGVGLTVTQDWNPDTLVGTRQLATRAPMGIFGGMSDMQADPTKFGRIMVSIRNCGFFLGRIVSRM